MINEFFNYILLKFTIFITMALHRMHRILRILRLQSYDFNSVPHYYTYNFFCFLTYFYINKLQKGHV